MRNFMAYFKFERLISALAKAFALLLMSATFAIVGYQLGDGLRRSVPLSRWHLENRRVLSNPSRTKVRRLV